MVRPASRCCAPGLASLREMGAQLTSRVVRRITAGKGLLEGPRYDPALGLVFSDARGGGVHCLRDDGSVTTLLHHRRGIGGIALHARGGFVVSGRNVAYKRDGEAPTVVLLDQDPDVRRNGFNDLTTDVRGRVYVGSLGEVAIDNDSNPDRIPGGVYLIDTDGSARQVADGISLVDGMALSPTARPLCLGLARSAVSPTTRRAGDLIVRRAPDGMRSPTRSRRARVHGACRAALDPLDAAWSPASPSAAPTAPRCSSPPAPRATTTPPTPRSTPRTSRSGASRSRGRGHRPPRHDRGAVAAQRPRDEAPSARRLARLGRSIRRARAVARRAGGGRLRRADRRAPSRGVRERTTMQTEGSVGRTALVTGGARGIGRALVETLAADRFAVVVLDVLGDLAREAAAAVETAGGQALAVEADVADTASVPRRGRRRRGALRARGRARQ